MMFYAVNPPSIFEELNYVYSKLLPPPLFFAHSVETVKQKGTANSGPISQHVERGATLFNPSVMYARSCLTSTSISDTFDLLKILS
jgi:hypothetical protein